MIGSLACPIDKGVLQDEAGGLACAHGHRFPVVDGIPILLVKGVEASHGAFARTFAAAEAGATAGISADLPPGAIDPVVQEYVAHTCGRMYAGVTLRRYPIPRLRLPWGDGRTFLDLGCGWGRWCIAAARLGYRAAGIDPDLDLVRAARRVARQLGHEEILFAVADARHLPFAAGSFDVVHSYSVLQHFRKDQAELSLIEAAATAGEAGFVLIQLPNIWAPRHRLLSLLRRSRPERLFDVRYWSPSEIRTVFGRHFDSVALVAHGFVTLSTEIDHLDIISQRFRLINRCSHALGAVINRLGPARLLAESFFVVAGSAARADLAAIVRTVAAGGPEPAPLG